MFRQFKAVALVASFSAFAACSPGQPLSQAGPGVAPQTVGSVPLARVSPDKDCGSAGGVKVAPCPVHLTKHTRGGVVVTVSGPGVVSSSLGHISGCFNGHVCYNAEREGSSQTQWRITSGRSCGAADVEFDGMNASGQQVGYFFLKVSNKSCHHH